MTGAASRSPEVRQLSRWLIVPAVLVVFVYTLAPPRAYDLWYYMRMGKEIVTRGEIPHDTNFLALPDQIPRGYDINPEWGFGVLTNATFSIAGPTGLSVLLALILTGIFTLVYATCRSTSMHPILCLAWSFGGLWMIRSRFLLRTQLVTVLFLGLLILLLLKAREGRKLGLPWVALPLFVLWANFHPGVLSGVVLLGAWTVGEFFHGAILKKKTSLAWTTLLGATLLAFVATFIRPGGWLVYQFTYDLMSKRTLAKSLVIEATPLTADWWQTALGPYLAVVVLCFLLALLTRTARLSHLLVALAFVYLTTRHNRAVGELYPTAGPLAAVSLMASWPVVKARWFPTARGLGNRAERILAGGCALLLVGLLVSRLTSPGLFHLDPPTDWYPVHSTRFLQENPVDGVLFNSYEFGGFLSWHDMKPYIHGMTGVYGDDLLEKHLDILADAEKRAKLIADDNITAFLLHYPSQVDSHRDLIAYLWDNPEWSLVFWDDASLVFVKSPPPTTEFRAVMPALLDPFPTNDLELARKELEEFTRSYPQIDKGWLLLAELNMRQRNFNDADKQLSIVLERRGDVYEPRLKRGSARFSLGDLEGAIQDLSRAVELAPESPIARFNLALALSKQASSATDGKEAEKLARRAKEQVTTALELQPDFPAARSLSDALAGY